MLAVCWQHTDLDTKLQYFAYSPRCIECIVFSEHATLYLCVLAWSWQAALHRKLGCQRSFMQCVPWSSSFMPVHPTQEGLSLNSAPILYLNVRRPAPNSGQQATLDMFKEGQLEQQTSALGFLSVGCRQARLSYSGRWSTDTRRNLSTLASRTPLPRSQLQCNLHTRYFVPHGSFLSRTFGFTVVDRSVQIIRRDILPQNTVAFLCSSFTSRAAVESLRVYKQKPPATI